MYKVTVRSVIDYSNRLQYRAAKLVTGALHFSIRKKLNQELGCESIIKRMEFHGLSLFKKIHFSETNPLIEKCRSKLDIEVAYTNVAICHTKCEYMQYQIYGHPFQNSFFPFMS